MGGFDDAEKTLTFPCADGCVTVTLAATAVAPDGTPHAPPVIVNELVVPQAIGLPERVSTVRQGGSVKNWVAGPGTVISTAPRSQAGPCGRGMPRWSDAITHAPASMAGLPACSKWVGVYPPFCDMGVTRSGSATIAPLAHDGLFAGNSRTPPPFVSVLEHWSWKGEGKAAASLLATIVLRSVPLVPLWMPPPVKPAKLKAMVEWVMRKGCVLETSSNPPPLASEVVPSARLLLIV